MSESGESIASSDAGYVDNLSGQVNEIVLDWLETDENLASVPALCVRSLVHRISAFVMEFNEDSDYEDESDDEEEESSEEEEDEEEEEEDEDEEEEEEEEDDD